MKPVARRRKAKAQDTKKRAFVAGLVALTLLVSAQAVAAGESSAWDRVHKVFSKSYGAKKHGRFGMFFGSMVMKFAKPDGVKGVKIALYRDADTSRDPHGTLIEGAVGSDWSQILRAVNREGMRTHIFTRWKGETNVEVMVVTVESGEATVVRAELEPEKLANFVAEIR